jgi:hypothetical protein
MTTFGGPPSPRPSEALHEGIEHFRNGGKINERTFSGAHLRPKLNDPEDTMPDGDAEDRKHQEPRGHDGPRDGVD